MFCCSHQNTLKIDGGSSSPPTPCQIGTNLVEIGKLLPDKTHEFQGRNKDFFPVVFKFVEAEAILPNHGSQLAEMSMKYSSSVYVHLYLYAHSPPIYIYIYINIYVYTYIYINIYIYIYVSIYTHRCFFLMLPT